MHWYKHFSSVCLIQTNYVLLACFTFKLHLWHMFNLRTYIQKSRPFRHNIFPPEKKISYCILACNNTGTCTFHLTPKLPNATIVCLYVCSNSSMKPLGQLKPDLTWNRHGIGEENLSKWFWLFVVLHLDIFSLQGGGLWQGVYHKLGPVVKGLKDLKVKR